ncbi:SDR family NAD(P)-dependent oxidoreductase [Streptomyces sp. UG1]|uniref:SDR family NAD(P)-dependent oxidoreductase n=1 Tax=Streptomyces sp. UG1 TaxID=3417652 RepID=UPI003CF2BF45
MRRLAGKVAMVTSAGSAIGAAIARRLHAEGACVVAFDWSGAEDGIVAELNELRAGAVGVRGDIRKGDDVRRAVATAVERFGKLDVLVNNAGIAVPLRRVTETSEDDFDRGMAINARGVFLGMKHSIQAMIETSPGSGSVINTASTQSIDGMANMVACCGSKGAVALMTKAVAVEVAPLGIRVNAVCPGPTGTDIKVNSSRTAVALPDEAKTQTGSRAVTVDEAAIRSMVPIGRVCGGAPLPAVMSP